MPNVVGSPLNRYQALIELIFFDHWKRGRKHFVFEREEIVAGAKKLNIVLPKNIGDAVYSIRYRTSLPKSVASTQPRGFEWIVEGAGRSKYRFKLVPASRIRPRSDLAVTAIPDATPELIQLYRLDDEQALLAILRYNRLIDTFLGLTTYSLQNHLRTTVKDLGQIEIDELYVGIDRRGCHYALPVQAKGGKDQIGVVQTAQDIRFCEQNFPGMRCRPIAAQFMADDVIALFELTLEGDEVKVVDEKHYKLVPASTLDPDAVRAYRL